MTDTIADVVATICFLGGAFLVMVAGIGIARFPDLLSRMHAATKPQVLGLVLFVVGLAVQLRIGAVGWTLLLIVLFQLITAPVSAHMVGRAGYRTGRVRTDLLVVDELTDDLARVANVATADPENTNVRRTSRGAAEDDDGR
ncbi:monovalent cation/proton antiporter, MnhG/PhaG subunit [Beutenbergia cavernae DSM 12333]|uniref:Monovalent cation/proton antiporter, MnhG/PhaG subunit n=1 Tax=Beutenbergia cavernae (strain ATCC BAA-8 / DSM 12333 / CCUG 43141 / JCM 11478 / NBRC 16432 / NCIMB 13614 / HKI 0122) TaxID=471853 RepID=C5C4D1_BEUC1|nr:monovalent cation/H(+) antiporter subunit G [Beutenbergia cavernae]ACQ82055.1 monovalent cation/proton antiporter, MnhG/PhaG subunit [Beutenbergia cavernae DSM 12333]